MAVDDLGGRRHQLVAAWDLRDRGGRAREQHEDMVVCRLRVLVRGRGDTRSPATVLEVAQRAMQEAVYTVLRHVATAVMAALGGEREQVGGPRGDPEVLAGLSHDRTAVVEPTEALLGD